jgi:FixJ family two-component response regulator
MEDGGRLIVAVIDDDEAVRDSLRFLLETAGFAVDTFASACQFLAASLSHARICLLVDQHMPHLTGLDLLRRLHALGPMPRVALMTGSPSDDLTRQAMELGVVAVLEKPLAEDTLFGFVSYFTG